ncbi:hypothetical protein [Pectobacterium aroidearum]|uniref:hypothetical protein n=1 Tax=Pectobacterium aroidearum TaxID=1201031 RepID=UPI0032EF409E
MTDYTHIMKEIKKIISFCMVKGVQPHELVTSIFECEYQNVEVYKKGNFVHLILTYLDSHDDGANIIKMKYVYNNNHQLLSVSQKIDSSSYKTQWDRNEKLDVMLNKLAAKLPKDSKVINHLREQIPDEYKMVFYPHLKIAS